MLPVHQGPETVCRLSSLQQQRVAGCSHCWLSREHEPEPHGPGAQSSSAHQHQHAGAEAANIAPRSGLVAVNNVDEAVRHVAPVAGAGVKSGQRRGIRLPGCPRCITGERVGAKLTGMADPVAHFLDAVRVSLFGNLFDRDVGGLRLGTGRRSQKERDYGNRDVAQM
jgi:hypothetical protein